MAWKSVSTAATNSTVQKPINGMTEAINDGPAAKADVVKMADAAINVSKGKRASLPSLMDLRVDVPIAPIILALEEAHALKQEIGEVPDEEHGKPGSGKLKRLDELKNDLMYSQAELGLDGLRHNKLVFAARGPYPGRATLVQKTLEAELISRGVDVAVINAAIEAATKVGESYWVRELVVLK